MPGLAGELSDKKIKFLWRATQPNPFNILILGDGFTFADEALFNRFLRTLVDRFFRIPPFNYCKPYINILYLFTPSRESGILTETTPGDPERTVFQLYLSPGTQDNQRIGVWDNEHVVDIVSSLVLPADLELPAGIPKEPNALWFGRTRRKSYGAVGIIANSKGGVGQSLYNEESTPPNYRFFVTDMTGFEPLPGQPEGGYEHRFAHELAHSLMLNDEYERTTQPIDGDYQKRMINSKVNTQYIDRIPSLSSTSPQEFLDGVPWRLLMSTEEREHILSGDYIFLKEDLEADGVIDDADALDTQRYSTVPKLNRPPYWRDIFIVEGAVFNRRVYRSNFACKMRHSLYQFNNADSPSFISDPFCHICNYQIRKHISGWESFGIGRINREKLMSLFYDEVMPRINQSFDLQNAEDNGDRSTDRYYCDIASARGYIVLRNFGLKPQFIITGLHVCLYLHGIILDPTFYDFYRVRTETGPLRYISWDGTIKNFEEGLTTRGLAGDLLELENFFHELIPREGSYAQRDIWDLPGFVKEMTEEIFDIDFLWIGAEDDPDRTKINIHNPQVAAYSNVIVEQWKMWEEYCKNGQPSFLSPLARRAR